MTRQTTMDMVTSLKIFTGFLFPDQFDKTMHGFSLNNMCEPISLHRAQRNNFHLHLDCSD